MWFGREHLDAGESASQAHRSWWDEHANEYLEEHGQTLGDADFIWGPEGFSEEEAHVLGDLSELVDKRILEFGAGAAQCSRFLALQGCRPVASDISGAMLDAAATLNRVRGIDFPLVQADVLALPFLDASFDVAFTSFGALSFIEDLGAAFSELARVLTPGGRLAYSALHPVRWMFPDSPHLDAMTVHTSYFSREPYVERDDDGELTYVEFPHTLSEHTAALAQAGFLTEQMWEPEWPENRDVVWGGWGPERSKWLPGTLIVRSRKAA